MSKPLTLAELERILEDAMKPRPRAPDGSLIISKEEHAHLQKHGALIIQDGHKMVLIVSQEAKEDMRRIINGEHVDNPRLHAALRLIERQGKG